MFNNLEFFEGFCIQNALRIDPLSGVTGGVGTSHEKMSPFQAERDAGSFEPNQYDTELSAAWSA